MASQPKYENVQLDDHDEAGSTTDVEDSSLMGDEKKWQDQGFEGRPKRAKRSRLLSILQTGRWCLDTVLLLAILGLLVRQQLSTPQTVRLEVGSDFTGVAPKCKSMYGVSPTHDYYFHLTSGLATKMHSSFAKDHKV